VPWFQKASRHSAPWRGFTRHIVLPWVVQGTWLSGEVMEIGARSGAMAEHLLTTRPAIIIRRRMVCVSNQQGVHFP